VVGEPAPGTAALALVGEQVEAGQLVRVLDKLVAEAAEGAAAVDSALQPIGQRGDRPRAP
jgi:hypothetical protein